MDEPVLINLGSLSENEKLLFTTWQDRVHEFALAERRKMDLYLDAGPMLPPILEELFPDMGWDDRIELGVSVFLFAKRALDDIYKPAAGRA